MALVEFVEVAPEPLHAEGLWGWHLDYPLQGARSDAAAVEVRGWVLGRSATAVAVEVVADDQVIRRTLVDRTRKDVAAAYPHVAGAACSGFQLLLSMLGTGRTHLQLQAVLADQSRIPLVSIKTERRWREEQSSDVPLVSVVIPCYNQAHYLGEAIESVLRQTYPHLEVVVVDDGSRDNTAEVAARYPGVRCIRQPNRGLAEARNTGIRGSNGSYLVFLDADDRLLPQALEAGLASLSRHPESAYCVGRFRLINDDGIVTGESSSRAEEQREYYLELLRFEGHTAHHAVMYRRDVFETVTGFDPMLRECEDYDLYLRIARLFPISFHNTIVADYRRYGGGMSYKNLRMLRSMKRVLRRERRYIRQNRQYREAYEIGMRAVAELYGQPAISDLRARVRENGWSGSGLEVLTLLCIYPRGLVSFVVRGG